MDEIAMFPHRDQRHRKGARIRGNRSTIARGWLSHLSLTRMKGTTMNVTRLFVFGGFLLQTATPLGAQDVDMQALMAWSNAEVVNYKIVGIYSGPTDIAFKEKSGQLADVTDTVAIDLQWNVSQERIIGQPSIQNSASQVSNLRNDVASCETPVIKGTYEQLELTSVEQSEGNRVELVGTTSFPEVDLSDCTGAKERRTVGAQQDPVVLHLPIVPPMMLAMPETGNPSVSIAPDKKSFVVRLGNWTWTFTPALVS